MMDNIVDVESQCIAWSTKPVPEVVMFFLDFAAAFPSMAHAFIFLVLEAIGVPCNIIRAIRKLYINNSHDISFGGSSFSGFVVSAGMKQGCPLSGVLFVICADVLVRALLKRIPQELGMVRAYADDIALVLSRASVLIPCLCILFEIWERATCMALNLKKCVAVPLSWLTLQSFRDMLLVVAPQWSVFKVTTNAKYLGVYLGPGGVETSLQDPLRKYISRCHMIRAMGVGLTMSVPVQSKLP